MNLKEERIGNYIWRMFYDDCGFNPREDSNLTKMVCFHKRYNLGDDHDLKSDDFDSWDEMEKYITSMEDPLIIKPLYLYDHSGITIRTRPFGDRWDSGQVGFVYVRKQDVRDNFFIKRCGQRITERVDVLLEGEVEMYDKYLTGEVYGYEISKVVMDEDGDEHEKGLERCGGYFDEDQCEHDCKVNLQWFIDNEEIVVV
jgi:hypothetical protein